MSYLRSLVSTELVKKFSSLECASLHQGLTLLLFAWKKILGTMCWNSNNYIVTIAMLFITQKKESFCINDLNYKLYVPSA